MASKWKRDWWRNHIVNGSGIDWWLIRNILSVPFCPCHFLHTILSNAILSVYHFVHTILSVPFCPLPYCPRTHGWHAFTTAGVRMKQKSCFKFLPWPGFESRTTQANGRERDQSTTAHPTVIFHISSKSKWLFLIRHKSRMHKRHQLNQNWSNKTDRWTGRQAGNRWYAIRKIQQQSWREQTDAGKKL